MTDESEILAQRLLAALPEGLLDRLADLIALKLKAKNSELLPSKQVVAS